MELQDKKICFLGDSITEGVGASSIDNCYVNVFEKITGSKCLNYGIGGTRISRSDIPSVDAIFDQDFVLRMDSMDVDADVVVVFGGTNDFGHGRAPLGKISDNTEYTFYGALRVLFEKLMVKYPKSELVVITPLHRLSENETINEIGIPCEKLVKYVDAIIEVAREYSIPVLDLFANSGMQPRIESNNKMYFVDGLHPNDLGHKRIAELLKKFLESK